MYLNHNELATLTGIQFDPDNIRKDSKELLTALRSALVDLNDPDSRIHDDVKHLERLFKNNHEDYKSVIENTLRRIEAIEKIVDAGVPVYIAAGNRGEHNLDPVALSDAPIMVGAVDERGEKMPTSSSRGLTERVGQGVFPITRVRNGVDVTGDGGADFPTPEGPRIPNPKRTRDGKLPHSGPGVVHGTSIAAPQAIVADLAPPVENEKPGFFRRIGEAIRSIF